MELKIPSHDSKLPTGRRASSEDGPALIMLSLVSANIRNCQLPSSKVRALDVFLALCPKLTDEAKLDRMVPYIIELLHDEAAMVRIAALRTLFQVVSSFGVDFPEKNGSTHSLAHAGESDHTFKRCNFPRVYHSKYRTSCERPRGFCKVHIRTMHSSFRRHSTAVFGDGTSIEGTWRFQALRRRSRLRRSSGGGTLGFSPILAKDSSIR